MTAKLTASADGTKVTIGTAAEDALQIDATAKTIKALAPYQMGGNGPAFLATDTATTSSAGATTQVVFDTEVFDTGNCFDGTTFTPNVAGYYQVNAAIQMGASVTSASTLQCNLRKNGGNYLTGIGCSTAGFGCSAQVSSVIYMNGTTDYLDVQSRNSVNPNMGAASFSAALVRAA